MQLSSQRVVFVLFVGGPFHGKGILMANPELTMLLGEIGEDVCYCRRSVEPSQSPNAPNLVFYAPKGMSEGQFNALIADDSKYSMARGPVRD